MKKLVVYSHDTFGLGNIKRMLAITQHLLDTIPELSVLLISGSPMIHSFRLPEKRFDYLKLPCLGRTVKGEYTVKKLGTSFDELVAVRTQIIQATVANFDPDIMLVDKKPRGVADELMPTLELVQGKRKRTEVILLLRDILDAPETTSKIWWKNDYFGSIDRYYSSILVMGSANVFDVSKEYRFPSQTARKLDYCGYTRRFASKTTSDTTAFFSSRNRPSVLVTAGGGEDGFDLINNYLSGLKQHAKHELNSLIITGPEMSSSNKDIIQQVAEKLEHVQVLEFTPHLTDYMREADLVVSMAGYNTIVEILSMNKRAVVIPRVKPVQEQLIRAMRLEQLGLLRCVAPPELTPHGLMDAVTEQLAKREQPIDATQRINFEGLPNLTGIFEKVFDGCADTIPSKRRLFGRSATPCYATGERVCLVS